MIQSKKNQAIEKANEEIRKIRLQWSLYDRQKADSIFQRIKFGIVNVRVADIIRNDKLDLTNDLKEFKKPIYIICGRQDTVMLLQKTFRKKP